MAIRRQVVGGAVVGAIGVMIVGEAWHGPTEEPPEPKSPNITIYVTRWQHHEHAPHREPRGDPLRAYRMMMTDATTTWPAKALPTDAREEPDLRDLRVPVTFTGSGYVFGLECWRSA